VTETAPKALPAWTDSTPLAIVGRSSARASAFAKVVGAAEYAIDVSIPGMAYAALVRSTIPRGKVIRFDATRAMQLAGVISVFGPFDGEWITLKRMTRAIIGDEVRFVGEEIGVVVAETEALARRAATLVMVEYDRWKACTTVEQALDAEAPNVVAADGNIAGGVERVERGDLAAAEAGTDVVIEHDYSTEAQHHNPLEPHGCVAAWDSSGLTLWDSNQGAHMIRESLADNMGMPREQVRVVSRFVGGGFGSKILLKSFHVITAEAARRLGRPVRLFMGRREEFIASHQRAASWRRIRIGAKFDGRLTFIDESITGQAGPTPAFAGIAARANNGLRLHKVDAIRADIRRVHTNTQDPTPFRGPAAAEDLFCLEQAIDEMAYELGIDPLDFRLRNLAETDIIAGLPYAGKELETCYKRGAAWFGWQFRPAASVQSEGKARGIGVGAVAYDATLYEPSKAEIALLPSGEIELRIGVSEIGCGADTIFAQIAAEELRLPVSLIKTTLGDTGSTPRSIDSTNHSRTTAVVGPTVRAAAHSLRAAILDGGATLLQAEPSEVTLDPAGVTRHGSIPSNVTLKEIAGLRGPIIGVGDREEAPKGLFPAMFGAHFVEVEVHLRTGRVRVLRAICAHDAGRIINPMLAQSQVRGGFLQGMGMALQEERVLDRRTGQMLNAAMWAYRTPSCLDAPMVTMLVDAGRPDRGNSLGVKGIGEPPLMAAGAAIANAIYNAIGVRMRSYPITPSKILAAVVRGET
jgi:xanthine dehydrogenase YagR molybdenum-binding subunit